MSPQSLAGTVVRSLCAGRARLPRVSLVVSLLVFWWGGAAQAQEEARLVVGDSLWEVELADGESYVGRIMAISGDTVTLETATGTRIQFTRRQAVRVRPARGSLRGEAFWREDPNITRLFFSPTARTLPRGGGYFGVYELFIPFVAYGITDRFLIAGGSPFYLAFSIDEVPPVYLGPKFMLVSTPRFAASLGALAVVLPDGDDTETFGIVYGAGTWGSADHAVSGGLGWGYIDDDISERPVVMVGGETRVGRFTKLMTENLFVPGEAGVIASAGVRFFGERLSADAGLAGLIGDGGECCFPLVNFVYNFGAGR